MYIHIYIHRPIDDDHVGTAFMHAAHIHTLYISFIHTWTHTHTYTHTDP